MKEHLKFIGAVLMMIPVGIYVCAIGFVVYIYIQIADLFTNKDS